MKQILQQIDQIIEQEANSEPPRDYLGLSGLGRECGRALWYGFRHAKKSSRPASLIRAAQDGFAGEKLMIERFKMVDGVKLEFTGKDQLEFSDLSGFLAGHPDGLISGISPNIEQYHIWEHKQCQESKFNKLVKLVDGNESTALKGWDYTYYCQAMLYCYYSELDSHMLTCSTPGGRATISCQTESNTDLALQLIEKAKNIIFSDAAPQRINNSPSFYLCKWCEFSDICHTKTEVPQLNCRTCLHSTPETHGGWSCAKHDIDIDENFEHVGCDKHLYLPDILNEKAVESDGISVTYADGRVNFEGGRVE